MFCHEGGGWIDLAGRHDVAPGSLVQIPSWMVHRVRWHPSTHYSALMFDAELFPVQWTRSLESQRVSPVVLNLPHLENRFERWQDSPEELLPRLAAELPAVELPDSVRNALALAHAASSQGGGAGEIADRLGYSLPHLTSQVRRYTGRSLGQWVQDARLDLAVLSLRSGDATVAQVAQRCGYVDLSHFRRAFKKKTGKVPSQIQQEIKNDHF